MVHVFVLIFYDSTRMFFITYNLARVALTRVMKLFKD